jgi:hypothetical protein
MPGVIARAIDHVLKLFRAQHHSTVARFPIRFAEELFIPGKMWGKLSGTRHPPCSSRSDPPTFAEENQSK